jgi:hypothetical protein
MNQSIAQMKSVNIWTQPESKTKEDTLNCVETVGGRCFVEIS